MKHLQSVTFQEKMMSKFPRILENPSELSRLLMMRGRWEKAETVLRNVEKIWPNSKMEKCLLGLCLGLKRLKTNKGTLDHLSRFFKFILSNIVNFMLDNKIGFI
jgi:hypothetical protein